VSHSSDHYESMTSDGELWVECGNHDDPNNDFEKHPGVEFEIMTCDGPVHLNRSDVLKLVAQLSVYLAESEPEL
jgi:hypothetical protein